MQGFLLGLASGASCVAYCAPALVPYLLGEGKGVRQNTVILCQFLGGRLCGYLLLAVLAWEVNRYVGAWSNGHEMFLGAVYILLAAALALYGLINPAAPCAGHLLRGRMLKVISRQSALLPFLFGFFTGLNLCPSFLLALTSASAMPALSQSLLFFLSFFFGTALYFIPVPLLGVFKNLLPFRAIGRLAAIVIAIYYLYTGIIMLTDGGTVLDSRIMATQPSCLNINEIMIILSI